MRVRALRLFFFARIFEAPFGYRSVANPYHATLYRRVSAFVSFCYRATLRGSPFFCFRSVAKFYHAAPCRRVFVFVFFLFCVVSCGFWSFGRRSRPHQLDSFAVRCKGIAPFFSTGFMTKIIYVTLPRRSLYPDVNSSYSVVKRKVVFGFRRCSAQ